MVEQSAANPSGWHFHNGQWWYSDGQIWWLWDGRQLVAPMRQHGVDGASRSAFETTRPDGVAEPAHRDFTRFAPLSAIGKAGKWAVVIAAGAAITAVATLAVQRLDKEATKPGEPAGAPVDVVSVDIAAADGGRSFAFAHDVRLSDGQLNAIHDYGPMSTKGYCEFRFRLKVLDDKKTSMVTVGDSVKVGAGAPPFKITSQTIVGGADGTKNPGAFAAYRDSYVAALIAGCTVPDKWVRLVQGTIPKPAPGC